MKVSERFALNEWLSDYPHDKSYDEIIDMIYEQDDSVTAWEVIECYAPQDIANFIENTRLHFESVTEQTEEKSA